MTTEETYTPGDVVIAAVPTGDPAEPFASVEAVIADPVHASRNRLRIRTSPSSKVLAIPADHVRPTSL